MKVLINKKTKQKVKLVNKYKYKKVNPKHVA